MPHALEGVSACTFARVPTTLSGASPRSTLMQARRCPSPAETERPTGMSTDTPSDLVREEDLLGLPRDEVPQQGTGSRVAYDLMTNELLLDGSARLNLATFVTTWMPPDAARLMAETADKNMIDKDEYPQTAEFERRCVNMIGRLWHAPGEG